MHRIVLALCLTLSAGAFAAPPLELEIEIKTLRYDGLIRKLNDPADDIDRNVRVRARPFRSTGAWLLDEKIPLTFSEKKGKPDEAKVSVKKQVKVGATDEVEVQLTIATNKGKVFNYVSSPKRSAKKNSLKILASNDGHFRLGADDAFAWPEVGTDMQLNSMCELQATPADVQSARKGGDDFLYDAKGDLIIDLLLRDKESNKVLHVSKLNYEAKGNLQNLAMFQSGPFFPAREGKPVLIHASFLTKNGKALVATGEAVPWTRSLTGGSGVSLPLLFALSTADKAVPKDAKADMPPPATAPAPEAAAPPPPAESAPAAAPAPAPAAAAPAPEPSPAPAAAVAPAPAPAAQPAAAPSGSPLMGRKRMSSCERSCERSRKGCYCSKSDAACSSKCDGNLDTCMKACN